ncbi:MAG: hypothetical protein RSD92_07250 [Erysipelotrichaceae bacterium]
MKKLLLFAAIAAFSSCSSDDNFNVIEQGLKIKKQTNTISGEMNYVYGSNGFISEIRSVQDGLDYVTKYNYNGNKLINKRYYSDNKLVGGLDLKYNESGFISQTVTINQEPSVKIDYTYNNENVLIESKLYSNDYLTYTANYQYSGNNCTKRIITYTDGSIMNTEYQFEVNSVNPYKFSETPEIRKIYLWGDNMVKKENDFEYQIEYNEKRYPVKMSLGSEVLGTFSYQ